MNRIAAAENLIIESSPDTWRLLVYNREAGDERGLMEARPERPLRYAANFARTRRLPTSGALPLDYVWQVVLGWSHDDDSWHLGLLLATDLADARGSRWCELAYWPDPDPTVFGDMAQRAAQELATIINTPFNLVPPREHGERKPDAPPLPTLPIEVGMWTLERESNGQLQFTRSSRWMAGKLTRIAWYAFWIVIYLMLSVATLNSDLALPNSGTMLPNPELLPYLGLGTAAVLALMILYLIYEMLSKPNRIVIDKDGHNVAAMLGNSTRWYKNGSDLESVYVTQVVNRRGKSNTIYEGEINLHLFDGQFKPLVQQDKKEDIADDLRSSDTVLHENVIPLTRFEVFSDLQAAGLTVAEELGGIPCWYDRRIR